MKGIGTNQEPFSVTSEQRGHAVHLRLFGEIDIASTPLLEGWLRTAESNGNTAIVVDLEQVTFMDAGGLRAFLRASERASRSSRTFAIMSAPAVVQRILQITGTTHLLGAEALAFSPGPALERPSDIQRRSHTNLSDAPANPLLRRPSHRLTTKRPPRSSFQ